MTMTGTQSMKPTTPTSAMSQGATFVRPGAMAWGNGDPGRQAPASPATSAAIEHALAAADLARRMPAGVGIALNPGAEASVPIYPEGVGYLAATLVVTDGAQVRVGRPPADPLPLLSEIRTALNAVPGVRQASRAWLSVSGQGEGLVISVTLDDPASQLAHREVVDAVQLAVQGVPQQGFPIDVTFPGESEPDEVDAWISAYAEPFYIRS